MRALAADRARALAAEDMRALAAEVSGASGSGSPRAPAGSLVEPGTIAGCRRAAELAVNP